MLAQAKKVPTKQSSIQAEGQLVPAFQRCGGGPCPAARRRPPPPNLPPPPPPLVRRRCCLCLCRTCATLGPNCAACAPPAGEVHGWVGQRPMRNNVIQQHAPPHVRYTAARTHARGLRPRSGLKCGLRFKACACEG